MSKVYFSPYYTFSDVKDKTTFNDIANVTFLDPVPYISHLVKVRGKDDVFLKCPAVIEYLKNCFVILSPFDIELEFDHTRVRIVNPSQIDNPDLFKFISGYKINRTLEQPAGALPLLSLSPMYTFYSVDDVQLEILPPILFNTASKYNIVPGKLDINKWIRPLDWTFEIFNPNENLIIKRKDPLFVIRFTNTDNSKIKLERSFSNKDLFEFSRATSLSRTLVPNLSLKERYAMAASYVKSFLKKHHPKEFKEKEKKCPFNHER